MFDWDLWPWLVVDGAGGDLAVMTYRMELSIRRFQLLIGNQLLPVLRRVGISLAKALDAADRIGRA